MIVVRLKGGLGNQMFQYAAGRRLALHLGVELKLDTTAFFPGGDRQYALDTFIIAAEQLPSRELDRRLGQGRLLDRLAGYLSRQRRLQRVSEQDFSFNPAVLSLPNDVYLDGYWQSEKYFADVSALLRKEFVFRNPLQGYNAEISSRIKNCTAVALHVRRGDYINDALTNSVLGVCSDDYYRNCIDRIAANCNSPVFFVFSDDLEWARRHLPLSGNSMFVSGNEGAGAGFDLQLMSMCRHHILANSSFSWWGAWLAERPGQLVLAPQRWFRTSELDDRDLIPARWERIADTIPDPAGAAERMQ